MGRLTDDMIRLRDEIDTNRNLRGVFVDDLKTNVTNMQYSFHKDRADMAKKLRSNLATFVSELGNTVAEMKKGFNHDHADMACELRNDLKKFVSDLKTTVSGIRQEFAADIEGARQAWAGKSSLERKTKNKVKKNTAKLRERENIKKKVDQLFETAHKSML